jgi:hypothetical protein
MLDETHAHMGQSKGLLPSPPGIWRTVASTVRVLGQDEQLAELKLAPHLVASPSESLRAAHALKLHWHALQRAREIRAQFLVLSW